MLFYYVVVFNYKLSNLNKKTIQMVSEFSNMYYGISKSGYVLLQSNIDYSTDKLIMELINQYKKINFGDKFNQPIDYLPDGITHLRFGMKFNQPIDNLPQTLKYLNISSDECAYCEFNQPIDNLPNSLEWLCIILNKKFNHPIDNLPIGLKKLYLTCKAFKHTINCLPENLEELSIKEFNFEDTHNLPISLKNVFIKCPGLQENELTLIQENLVNKYRNIMFTINDLIVYPN